MEIKPALVKEFRERTGAGMMDCKKALVDAGGDIDAAAELLRKQGPAKADKKASRVAAEGRVVLKSDEKAGRHALVEVNSETDFVAKDDNFRGFAERVAGAVLAHRPASVEALMALSVDGRTLEESRQDLIIKVGENITVRRFEVVESKGHVGGYVHPASRSACSSTLEGGSAEARARSRAAGGVARPALRERRRNSERHPRQGARDHPRAGRRGEEAARIIAKMVEGKLASSSTSHLTGQCSSKTTRSACAIARRG